MASNPLSSNIDVVKSPFSGGKQRTLDLRARFRRHMGVHDTEEFLTCIGGRRTRWPILIAISLLMVVLVGYFGSNLLTAKARSSSTTETPADVAPTGEQAGPTAGVLDGTGKRANGFSLSFQAEAQAATNQPVGENAVVRKQVQDLLAAASEAVEEENLDSFLALLDESDSDFFRLQKAKARMAFKRFDGIEGTYSDVKITTVTNDELAVDLHCKVSAAVARTGTEIVLFNGNQVLTLRRTPKTAWKICAID